jgi:hypothetical protein
MVFHEYFLGSAIFGANAGIAARIPRPLRLRCPVAAAPLLSKERRIAIDADMTAIARQSNAADALPSAADSRARVGRRIDVSGRNAVFVPTIGTLEAAS